MRALTIALCLLANPALATVAGTARTRRPRKHRRAGSSRRA
jgi:hypothetical protein